LYFFPFINVKVDLSIKGIIKGSGNGRKIVEARAVFPERWRFEY
jgi:hypothetical protein